MATIAGAVILGGSTYLASRQASKAAGKAEKLGREDRKWGQKYIEEGLGGLRGLRGTYSDRLKDPLGEQGRGIFARARGNLSDGFARTVNSGMARRRQLAAQTGGSLTPEQIAALDAEDRRDANEQLFRGEGEIATTEAGMTLDETNRLYDRLENIDRTITGVGASGRGEGLQSILAALMSRNQTFATATGAALDIYRTTSAGRKRQSPPASTNPLPSPGGWPPDDEG